MTLPPSDMLPSSLMTCLPILSLLHCWTNALYIHNCTKFDCKRIFRILFQRKLFKSKMTPVLSFCNTTKNNLIKSLKKGEIRLLPDCYIVINDRVDQCTLIICLCCFLYSTKHFRCMDPVPYHTWATSKHQCLCLAWSRTWPVRLWKLKKI